MKQRPVLQGIVLPGDQYGRSIGVPTINLDPTLWPAVLQPGVYAASVQHADKTYGGALYFGPRLIKNETNNVLEVTLFDFAGDLYGQEVRVEVRDFIRPPIDFSADEVGETHMKQQIDLDVSQIQQLLARESGQ